MLGRSVKHRANQQGKRYLVVIVRIKIPDGYAGFYHFDNHYHFC